MAEAWKVLDEQRVLSGSEVRALLSTHVDEGRLTTYLRSDGGRLLTFVSNGTRAMVVLMERAGDPGEHAVSPGAVRSSDGYTHWRTDRWTRTTTQTPSLDEKRASTVL